MPSAHGAHIKYAWQMQPDATCNVVAAQNAWVTILAATEDVRVYCVCVDVTLFNETLEVEFLVDGNTKVASTPAVVGTSYIANQDARFGINATMRDVTINYMYVSVITFDGQSVRIRMRKTTAAGASALQGKVVWARLLPT